MREKRESVRSYTVRACSAADAERDHLRLVVCGLGLVARGHLLPFPYTRHLVLSLLDLHDCAQAATRWRGQHRARSSQQETLEPQSSHPAQKVEEPTHFA